jgi:hypothetical protein
MAAAPVAKIKTTAPTNIYSVLVIVATLFLLFGTVYLAWRNNELYQQWIPLGPIGS